MPGPTSSRALRSALAALTLAVLAAAASAQADTSNFDLSGKIYTKYMYKNDNTQGCLSLSNPFWVDNIGGNNGACTEFELNIKGRVSPRVTAGVRLQSRWGMLWQDWWENGDLKPGVSDTSGESLGMNHAAYIKLRGAYIRMAPPIPTVRWVTIGATDYSMWNEWTIGKARYIDRDNGNGVFIEGDALDKKRLSYTVGAMALPKLWAGPGWNTGLKDNESLASLYGTDWAFAGKLDSQLVQDLRLRFVGAWLQDWEADKYSPMLTGPPDAARGADHRVALSTRFRGLNGTLDGSYTGIEWLGLSGLVAASSNYVNPAYATNLVRNGQGFSPIVFKTNARGQGVASNGYALKLDAETYDPFQTGLSFRAEYFNIGAEYNAVMGARREADVLLTDGIITGGFTRGGQLPTLNIANEFVDWDEPWYESVIGWHGGTLVADFTQGPFKYSGEATFITYNTNKQNRDVQNTFPDFLYTTGFTDPAAFTADGDYANVYDRGKDPRSVYAEFQDRMTLIAVLNAQAPFPLLPRGQVTVKAKFVHDQDNRDKRRSDDNYLGREYLGFAVLSCQPTDQLKTFIGGEATYWDEARRNGNKSSGFYDATTRRFIGRVGANYAFGGALLSYTLEYFHKDLNRDPAGGFFDMKWNVVRAKATFEAAW